ncbi:MAG TPA: DUF3795 domain-containing protein [Candidatus Magasanikbacteria bacterium]|nr:DUF3795 domain-containing protein [Candidatus Magasanikbacteria bacterium]
MKSNLIAPCGMNCAICLGYLREKNHCPGCQKTDAYESGYGRKCVIRSCAILKQKRMKFCSDQCEKYPCKRLKNLDKRYRTKYNMSMIENLEFIKDNGIRMFIKKEKEKWTCKKCGGTICVHRKLCLKCGNKK